MRSSLDRDAAGAWVSMTTVEDAATVEPEQRSEAATRFATGLIGLIAVGVALLSALTTFVVLADLTPISPTHYVVVTLLGVNAVAVLLLLVIIGREVWHIVQARRRRRAAARLHVQIVGLFSVIAAAPAVLVAVVASITLDRGFDQLFSNRTRAVITNSLIVSQAYVNEHEQSIKADLNAMAIDLARAKPLFDQDRDRFRQFFTAQASLRDMPTAMMLGADDSVIMKADVQLPSDFKEPPPPPADRLAQVERCRAGRGPASRHQSRRCAGQAARLRQHLSVRGALHRSAGAGADPADRGQHRRICEFRGAAHRRADRLRADVHRHMRSPCCCPRSGSALPSPTAWWRRSGGSSAPPTSSRPEISMSRFRCAGRRAISPSSARPSTA